MQMEDRAQGRAIRASALTTAKSSVDALLSGNAASAGREAKFFKYLSGIPSKG